MTIVFDARWLGRTGIGRYAAELLDQLQDLDHTNQYFVLLLPDMFKTWQPRNPNFKPVLTTYEVYTWQEQLLLPRQLKALKPDLVHFTSFNLPMFYRGRFITTVHDLTLVHFKNVQGTGLKKMLYELKYRVMLRVLRSAVRRAHRIIVPTRYGRDDLVKLFPAAKTKTVVTYEAAQPMTAPAEDLSQFNLPKTFLLYVGNYYPYKNIDRLVEAFAHTNSRQNGVKLVLAGPDSYFQHQTRRHVIDLGLEDDVVFTGRASDGQLVSLYRAATLYVFPSLSEGFGLPGLEAMTYGLPVLAARATCLPELYGDAAAYCDPYNSSDMATQIDELLADDEMRAQLKAAGLKRSAQFSWATMARETLDVYNSR